MFCELVDYNTGTELYIDRSYQFYFINLVMDFTEGNSLTSIVPCLLKYYDLDVPEI